MGRVKEMRERAIDRIYQLYEERAMYEDEAHHQLMLLGVPREEATEALGNIDANRVAYIHRRTGA